MVKVTLVLTTLMLLCSFSFSFLVLMFHLHPPHDLHERGSVQLTPPRSGLHLRESAVVQHQRNAHRFSFYLITSSTTVIMFVISVHRQLQFDARTEAFAHFTIRSRAV